MDYSRWWYTAPLIDGFKYALVSLTNVEKIKNYPTMELLPYLIILNKRKLYCNWSLWHHYKKSTSYPTWVLIQGLINQNDYLKLLWPVNLLAYEIEESLGLWISYSCKVPPEFPKFPVNSNRSIVWIIYHVYAKKLWILRLMNVLHKCTHYTYFWNIVNMVCKQKSHGIGLYPISGHDAYPV